jgi:multicomponent Na+:H+ antiporter subunit F
MIDLLIFVAMGVVGLSAVMGTYRLVVGPTATDRVIGMDLLFAVAIFASMLASVLAASRGIETATVYLDVAIGLTLTGFVSTIAWARVIQMQGRSQVDKEIV